MNTFDQNEPPQNPNLAVYRIITAALIFGVSMFLGYVLLQDPLGQPPKPPVIAPVGLFFATFAIAAQFAVPFLVRIPNGVRTSSNRVASLLGIHFTRHILRMAILEGAAFFNTFALMSEHYWWSLAVVGVLLFLMLQQWPTQARLEQWLEARLVELELFPSE
jgi:hypothetical protein